MSTRAMLRQRVPVHLHRKQIALAAGVAPGLVTYYFQDEASLIEAAARPIIDSYLQRLKATLQEGRDLAGTLRQLVLLLIEISRDNGLLLDSYITFIKLSDAPHKAEILTSSYVEIEQFLRRCVAMGIFRPGNSAFMATALWGICKTVAQLPELIPFIRQEAGPAETDVTTQLADMIVDLVLRALQHPEKGPT